MGNVKGTLTVEVEGEEFTLFLGMSVIADLQAKHGQDVLERLQPPDGGANPNWVPDLSVVVDVVVGALKRFHPDAATRWTADDILAHHGEILGDLMAQAFPTPQGSDGPPAGKGRKPKKAAA